MKLGSLIQLLEYIQVGCGPDIDVYLSVVEEAGLVVDVCLTHDNSKVTLLSDICDMEEPPRGYIER